VPDRRLPLPRPARLPYGEVSTVYLLDADIEKPVKFLSQKKETHLLPARHTVGEAVIGFSETGE
jgi:hypothetical protein